MKDPSYSYWLLGEVNINQNLKAKASGRSQHDEYGASNTQDVKRLSINQNTSFIKTNGAKEVSTRGAKEGS